MARLMMSGSSKQYFVLTVLSNIMGCHDCCWLRSVFSLFTLFPSKLLLRHSFYLLTMSLNLVLSDFFLGRGLTPFFVVLSEGTFKGYKCSLHNASFIFPCFGVRLFICREQLFFEFSKVSKYD